MNIQISDVYKILHEIQDSNVLFSVVIIMSLIGAIVVSISRHCNEIMKWVLDFLLFILILGSAYLKFLAPKIDIVEPCEKLTSFNNFLKCFSHKEFTKPKLEIIDRQFNDDIVLQMGDTICSEKPFYIHYNLNQGEPFVIAEFRNGRVDFWKAKNGGILAPNGGYIKFDNELKTIYGFMLPSNSKYKKFIIENISTINWSEFLKSYGQEFSQIQFDLKNTSCSTLSSTK